MAKTRLSEHTVYARGHHAGQAIESSIRTGEDGELVVRVDLPWPAPPLRLALDEAYALGRALQELATDWGYDYDTDEVRPVDA